jgi:hypothetical protein
MGAQLRLPSPFPPILLYAIYAFPRSKDGDYTLYNRIDDYLKEQIPTNTPDPQAWQLDSFCAAVELSSQTFPDSPLFIGGDFNVQWPPAGPTRPWHSTVISAMESRLGCVNLPAISPHLNLQGPTSTYNHASDHPTWIDHILSRGPAVRLQSFHSLPPSDDPSFSDHSPLTTVFFTDHPSYMLEDPMNHVEAQASQLSQATHLPPKATAHRPHSPKEHEIDALFQLRAAHIISTLPPSTSFYLPYLSHILTQRALTNTTHNTYINM